MKITTGILAAVVGAAFLSAAAADAPEYVGASKCKDCHKTERQGKQYPIWEAGPHPQALSLLKTDGAKKIAATANVAGAPDQAPACLKCHAPLSEKAPALMAEGVSCEVCHGPGSLYRKLNVMMSRDESVKNGLILYASMDAVKAQCMTCHGEAHGIVLDFTAGWEKIKHSRPAK